MNDHCTPATAARLKAAGFPQPAPEFGQAWYIDNGALFLVVETFEANPEPFNGVWVIEKGGEVQHVEMSVFDDMIFAPGVADLLRALGGRACISEDSDKRFAVANNLRIKIDWEQISGTAPDWQWFDENPAEALAAAWLSENGNPADLDEFKT